MTVTLFVEESIEDRGVLTRMLLSFFLPVPVCLDYNGVTWLLDWNIVTIESLPPTLVFVIVVLDADLANRLYAMLQGIRRNKSGVHLVS